MGDAKGRVKTLTEQCDGLQAHRFNEVGRLLAELDVLEHENACNKLKYESKVFSMEQTLAGVSAEVRKGAKARLKQAQLRIEALEEEQRVLKSDFIQESQKSLS